MGAGPWQQAELKSDARKAERDRIRRIIRKARDHVAGYTGGMSHEQVLDEFDNLLNATKAPKRARP